METLTAISKLNKIFKNKNWNEKDIDEYVFDNFCQLIVNLNEEQRELLIDLVERYKWISISEYPEKILSTMEKVENDKLEKLKTIYLFPIIDIVDEGYYKSGQFLMYQIKAFKRNLIKYKDIKFTFIAKFETLKNHNFEFGEDEALFLIDDYIGSGETLNSCLREIKSNPNIENDKINIITIATQKETSELFKKQGISFYADYYSKKGLTDFEKTELLSEKIRIMLEIEDMIPGGKSFSLGYGQSEELITLLRTPDNTFPLFWMQYKKGSKKFEAPFSREETFEE